MCTEDAYIWLTLKFVDPKIVRPPTTPLLFEKAKFQNQTDTQTFWPFNVDLHLTMILSQP